MPTKRRVKRFDVLAWLAILLCLLPGSLAAETDNPLKAAVCHFPPYQLDPMITGGDKPGIGVELFRMAADEAGIDYRLEFYPVSRLLMLAQEGELDLVSLSGALLPKISDYMKCSEPVLHTRIALYQNMLLEPNELQQPQKELIGKSILIPKEFKAFFQTLLPVANSFQAVSKPHLLVKMFSRQRSAFMIDFCTRAESQLKIEPVTFPIRRYPILDMPNHLCINNKLRDGKEKLDALYRTLRSYKDRPITRQLEKEYQCNLKWD